MLGWGQNGQEYRLWGQAVLGFDQVGALNVSLNLWEPQVSIYKKKGGVEV